MTKQEFEKLLGEEVSYANFSVIETVYNFHPSISERHGKTEIVHMYQLGGMAVMEDMYVRAKRLQSTDEVILRLQQRITEVKSIKTEMETCPISKLEQISLQKYY